MKVIKVKDVVNCPVCGGKAVLRKNASKDFEMSCTKCPFRTGWTTKPSAIIEWYNMTIQYWKNAGKLNLDSKE